MKILSAKQGSLILVGVLATSAPATLSAQQQWGADRDEVQTTVIGYPPSDLAGMPEGPEIEGFIAARNGEKMKVTSADGSSTVVNISEGTVIRSGSGFLGLKRGKLGADSLLNGLPVTVKTVQWGSALVASHVKFRNSDFKTASMIRRGTEQGFAEQTAATEALRGRMADIDQYNIKGTTNVFFDTGKWNLSQSAQGELCAAASQAGAMDNALLLVVGYTDAVGSEEYNQILSERRAGRVVNYLQQQCGWKPWRMLSPTGMSEADPLASNDDAYGKSQNRRVSVNILVSKGLDGM